MDRQSAGDFQNGPRSNRFAAQGPLSARSYRVEPPVPPEEQGPRSNRYAAEAPPTAPKSTDMEARDSSFRLNVLPLSRDYIVRIEVSGCLTLRGFKPTHDPLTEVLGPSCHSHRVILNLQQVRRAETSGIAWLIRTTEAFAKGGGRLVMFNLPPIVDAMLKMLDIDGELSIRPTEAEAVAAIGTTPLGGNGSPT